MAGGVTAATGGAAIGGATGVASGGDTTRCGRELGCEGRLSGCGAGAGRSASAREPSVVVLSAVEDADEEAVGTFRVWSASKGDEGKAGGAGGAGGLTLGATGALVDGAGVVAEASFGVTGVVGAADEEEVLGVDGVPGFFAGAPSWLSRSSMGMRRWTWTSFKRPSSRWKRCSWR